MIRLWVCRVTVVAGVLALAGALSACSPYTFSKEVQSLSDDMKLIGDSYNHSAKQILAEQRLTHRIQWTRDKPQIVRGSGCSLDSTGPVPCDLAVVNSKPPPPMVGDVRPSSMMADASSAESRAARSDVCETTVSNVPAPAKRTVDGVTPLRREDLIKTLENYTAALAALTKASDRAEFNDAAAKVSNSVAALTQSAAAASGMAAAVAPAIGRITTASSNFAFWILGQGLDYQRLKELRVATGAACEPIHVLASALSVVLEEQRDNRLDGLMTLLVLRIQAVNAGRASPHIADSSYGAAIDNAQAAADAFQTVRATNPKATAEALSAAHDELVVAVRKNQGQFSVLMASLQMLGEKSNALAAAGKATSSPATNHDKQ